MIAVDLLSEIFILIVLGIYLKRNNVIDGHTVGQLTDLIVKYGILTYNFGIWKR